MLPVAVHFPVVGSYSSAEAPGFPPSVLALPPARSTLPSGSVVAVPSRCASIVLPVACQAAFRAAADGEADAAEEPVASSGFGEVWADGPELGLVETGGGDDVAAVVAVGIEAAGTLVPGGGAVGPVMPHPASRTAVSEKASQVVSPPGRRSESAQTISMPPGRALRVRAAGHCLPPWMVRRVAGCDVALDTLAGHWRLIGLMAGSSSAACSAD